VAGHVDELRTRRRIAGWARVATAWNAMRSIRLARFGDNMRGVAVPPCGV
jgi:L-arabinose isomerase